MRRDLNLNTVTLWAMWYTKYGPTTMQGWKGCDQLQTNQTITLTDARDNNQYTVAKLLDGKCWMTQNLRIYNMTIYDYDSDLAVSSFVVPNTVESGFVTNDFNTARVHIDSQYGGYYNWYTTVASRTTVNGDADSSLCPKNWRLPTNQMGTQIASQYSYSSAQQSPASFTHSGIWESGQRTYRSDNITLWATSTSLKSNTANYIHLGGSQNDLCGGGGFHKYYGTHIRCVFKSSE